MKYVLFVLLALVAGAAQAQQPCRTCQSSNATAQGVAELCARHRVLKHWGGNKRYEGVGMGSTPEQALNNCCYSRNGWRVVDQGVARSSNGRYYACKRYGR